MDHNTRAVVLDHGSAYLSFNQPFLDYFVRRYEDWITDRVKTFEPDFYGISSKSVEWLQHFNIGAKGVISNSINASIYRSISSGRDLIRIRCPQSSLVVAFVGRFIPEKEFIQLLRQLAQRILPSVIFVLFLQGMVRWPMKSRKPVRRTCFGLGDVAQRTFPPYFSKQMCFVFQLGPKAFRRYFLRLQLAERLLW